MSFNSFVFLPFILVILSLYYIMPHRKQNLLLLVGGYVFYGAWDFRILFLIIISTLVDYWAALSMERITSIARKRFYLAISLIVNLGILGFFKYADFFISGASDFLALFSLKVSLPVLNIILPAAISFYTFKTLSYTIDVYRGQIPPTHNIVDYALYVSFFPQLTAGPIERASALIPQISTPRSFSKDKFIEGLWLILWGFFKKLVISDNLGLMVNIVFEPGRNVTGVEILLGVYAFAFQVYCDFSGYTDIARGIGKLLGFETVLNFNLPYISRNPVEFWNRWHISLSTWLRDYIFLPVVYASMRRIKKPLGRLKVENQAYIVGTIITMLLGGLWHGAKWTFVAWGGFHGLLLAGHHVMTRKKKRKKKAKKIKIPGFIKIVVFFHITCIGWLFFRADNMAQAWEFLRRLFLNFSLPANIAETIFPLVFYLPMLLIFEAWLQNCDDPRQRPGWKVILGPLAVSLILLGIVLFSVPGGQGFIYAQF